MSKEAAIVSSDAVGVLFDPALIPNIIRWQIQYRQYAGSHCVRTPIDDGPLVGTIPMIACVLERTLAGKCKIGG